jgi:hypothetical protein
LFAPGKTDRQLFVTGDRLFGLKLHEAEVWSYFCACEVMRLFSVVLCVVIAVHKYDCRLFINGDHWKGHAVIETHEFDMICMFPRTVDASVT